MVTSASGAGAQGPAETLLYAENVSKRFPGVQALLDIDLTLNRGEVHALVGQNGAGKSTLVKCISGVHPPDGGRITFDGREITTYSPKHAYDLGIAVVAEGVESADQYEQIAQLECDFYQGFYFARPSSATEIEARLTVELGV